MHAPMSNPQFIQCCGGGQIPISIMTLRKTHVASKDATFAFRKNDRNSNLPTTASVVEFAHLHWPRSVVVGKRRPVGVALLEKRVAPFDRLVGAVGEACGLTGKQLLADDAVIDRVERVLQHSNRGW